MRLSCLSNWGLSFYLNLGNDVIEKMKFFAQGRHMDFARYILTLYVRTRANRTPKH